MGGGAAGGYGKSKQESMTGGKALDMAGLLEQETSPLRTTAVSQMLEALRTGGVGALNPVISRSIEASRSAASDAMRGLGTNLATKNLGATPLGGSVLGQLALQGRQQTNAIGPQMAFQIGQQGAPFASDLTGKLLAALSAYGQSSGSSFNFHQAANVGVGG